MVSTLTQIRCPQCSAPIQARIQQIVDVTQDPPSKAKFLSGSLNHIHCPQCGFQGQIATPLVYHDAEKELLITFIPSQVALSKDDQERIIGRLINEVTNNLPDKFKKGYLFQPKAALTMQSMVDLILEADGVSREEIEAQRKRIRLFEQMVRTPDEGLQQFVEEHDKELDEAFFQLATLSIRATDNQEASEAANKRLQAILERSSFGKRLLSKEEAIREASENIQAYGDSLTREKLIDLLIEAPDEDRVEALVSLTRPVLDYALFQQLTARIEQSQGDQKNRLTELRKKVLDLAEQIDKIQEARAVEAANLLKSLISADDLDGALRDALPFIDEFFLGILQANLRAAAERQDKETEKRLAEIDQRLRQTIKSSLPPGLRLVQEILEVEDQSQAISLLEDSAQHVDQLVVSALSATAQRLQRGGDSSAAERLKRLQQVAEEIVRRKSASSNGESEAGRENRAGLGQGP